MRSMTVRVGVALVLAWALAVPLRAEDMPRTFGPDVAPRITAEDVQKRIQAGEKPIVLDTRTSVGDVLAKGAVHLTNDQIETWAKTAPKDALIVAYCT